MRVALLSLSAFLIAGLASAQANDVVPPLKGNDTGGIIAWTPETQRFRHALAAEHCASFTKMHRITSVRARYGEYIGFRCYWPRGTSGVVLRSAY